MSVSLRTTREFLDLAYHTHFSHSSLLTFFRTGFNETFKITTTPLWSSRDLLRVCGARSPTQQILLHCGGGGRGSNMANPEPPKHFLGGAMLLKLKLFCSACAAVVISSSAFATVEVFCSAYSAMAAWSSNSTQISQLHPWSSNLPTPPWSPGEEWALFAVKCTQLFCIFLTNICHHCQTPHSHNISSVCLRHLGKPQSYITECYGLHIELMIENSAYNAMTSPNITIKSCGIWITTSHTACMLFTS